MISTVATFSRCGAVNNVESVGFNFRPTNPLWMNSKKATTTFHCTGLNPESLHMARRDNISIDRLVQGRKSRVEGPTIYTLRQTNIAYKMDQIKATLRLWADVPIA